MLRASIAGVVFIATAPFCEAGLLDAVFGAQCNGATVTYPAGTWHPRVAYEAAFAGKPNMSIPLVGSGFNRTLNLDGFCNDVLMNSSAFTCNPDSDTRGEFNAYVTDMVAHPTSAKITFDYVNCPLTAISLRRTKPGAQFEAEIRFEFDGCQAIVGHPASPVASAAVILGLRKAPGRMSNILPWMQEVCNVATTTPASSDLTIETSYPVTNVGKGQCKQPDSTSAKNMAGIETEASCKSECRSSIQIADATKQTEGACTGFAFSATAPTDKKCVMYSAPVTQLASGDAAWTCINMTMSQQDYAKSTVPPSAAQVDTLLTQNLHLREVMAGAHATMTTAKLMQVQPQQGEEGCYKPAWWFTIQDDLGNPASIPVMEAEWATFIDMIPFLTPEHKGVPSTMIIDRVLVKTCNPNAAGWGRECKMATPIGVCDYKQVVNAIVTGIFVPIIGWLVVSCFHSRCKIGRPSEEPENFPVCSFANIAVLSIIAVITCGAVAAGLSMGISYGFGAHGCLHGQREMVVVGVGAGLPAALAMIIGLLYMHHSRDVARGEPVQGGHVPTGHRLMLVEVPHGGDLAKAVPLNPDVLQTGTGAMSSYRAQGGPNYLGVQGPDQTSQFLSGFQSVPPGGSAFAPQTGH